MVIGGERGDAVAVTREERAVEGTGRETESTAKSRTAVFSSSGAAREFTTVREAEAESARESSGQRGLAVLTMARRVSPRGASESVTEHQHAAAQHQARRHDWLGIVPSGERLAGTTKHTYTHTEPLSPSLRAAAARDRPERPKSRRESWRSREQRQQHAQRDARCHDAPFASLLCTAVGHVERTGLSVSICMQRTYSGKRS